MRPAHAPTLAQGYEHGSPAESWSVVLGHTVTEARKAARKAGWTRRKIDGRLSDRCPDCSE